MPKKVNFNIKQYYDKQISDNNNLIKSLSLIANDNETKERISNLKKESNDLKKEFLERKKEVFNDFKKQSEDIKSAIKETSIVKKKNKRSFDSKQWTSIKNEIKNLKIRKKRITFKKYSAVYGSEYASKRKERISFYFRISLIILLLLLFAMPIWIVISYSTKTVLDTASEAKLTSFIPSNNGGASENYKTAFNALDFWNTIFVTLALTLVSNILIIVFASMAAWQLVRNNTWWSKLLFYIFVAAMILPFQVIMIPLVTQMRTLQLKNTMIGMIITYIGFGMALAIFMLHGFLKTVPMALEESASISGMGAIRIYYKVVLPLLKNTFITILVLNIMWIWNDYLLPSLLLNDQYGFQTLQVRLVDTLVTQDAQDLRALSAGIVILIVPPVLYFTIAQKKMVSGITNGSIK